MGSSAVECRSCGAMVYWRKHERTGKPAPIDAAPDPEGNALLLLQGRYRTLVGGAREEAVAFRYELRTNHFQTCPQSVMWKERGKGAKVPG